MKISLIAALLLSASSVMAQDTFTEPFSPEEQAKIARDEEEARLQREADRAGIEAEMVEEQDLAAPQGAVIEGTESGSNTYYGEDAGNTGGGLGNTFFGYRAGYSERKSGSPRG